MATVSGRALLYQGGRTIGILGIPRPNPKAPCIAQVALHWSLTQFTPAAMDVQPQNTLERAMGEEGGSTVCTHEHVWPMQTCVCCNASQIATSLSRYDARMWRFLFGCSSSASGQDEQILGTFFFL